jgi:EAL domain-containing protein (putative c-di-GMP-specific phosphodiesterase class I)
LLSDIQVKPENVIFEINEKMAIDNYELFRGALKDYSDIGIVHASDDVGTGYSNLEKIMELNPGFMKIDISLVRDIHNSYIKQQIIKAMVTLAKNLKSSIVAEGIECKEEYEVLKSLDVDYGQGYLFGKPSPFLEAANTRFGNLSA